MIDSNIPLNRRGDVMSEIKKPANPEDDWKIWLVVNPSVWLMPILFAVLVVALLVHRYVISLGYGF
jgi:light-harvesting complex 1 alpha chain